MNFVEAQWAEGVAVAGREGVPQIRFSVPETASPTPPHTLTLGIRPEDLYIEGHHPASRRVSEPFEATLDVVEPMGNEMVVYLSSDAASWVARVEPQPLPEPGSTVRLVADLDSIHAFDAITGASLRAVPEEVVAS